MSLGIVIVTHESAESLPSCLAGIGPEYIASTVVVDNASRDASAELARAAGARVLCQSENPGFGRAAMLGARSLTTSELCFLNPDCQPSSALFEAGLRALRGGSRRCAAPMLQEERGTIPGAQQGYSRTKLLADMLENNYGKQSATWLRRLPFHDDRSWLWAHGACLFIERTFFESLGGFDDRYFLYMEDVDLGRRVAAAEGEVVALDQCVVHRGARGAHISRKRRRALLDSGRLTYGRTVYGRGFEMLLRGLVLPARWKRGIKGGIKRRIESWPG